MILEIVFFFGLYCEDDVQGEKAYRFIGKKAPPRRWMSIIEWDIMLDLRWWG